MAPRPCPTCKGARLKPEALAVTIAGRNIQEIVDYSVLKAREFFTALEERVPFGERTNGYVAVDFAAAVDPHPPAPSPSQGRGGGRQDSTPARGRGQHAAPRSVDPYAAERNLVLTDREYTIGRQ